MPTPKLRRALIGIVLLATQAGCMIMDHRSVQNEPCNPGEILVERGRENGVIDGVGWVVGIPSKILLWNSRVDNHHISSKTEQQIRDYMAAHGLYQSQVRLNQYAPLAEWKRLTQNTQVAPGWRYTFGVFSTLGYTILPGRIFGGDHYNPYTDSVHIYSDVPSLALFNAAYANDVSSRQYPGTYAFSQSIMGLNLIHESICTEEAIAYTDTHYPTADLREAYNVLSPRYGMIVGGTVGQLGGAGTVSEAFRFGGLLAGHAYGRYQSSSLPDEALRSAISIDDQSFTGDQFVPASAQSTSNFVETSR